MMEGLNLESPPVADPGVEPRKSVNVRLTVSLAAELRRRAFDEMVTQGSIVEEALIRLWNAS